MWRRLKEPPEWVKKASDRYYHKCRIRPYDQIKHFYGNTFVYKVFYKSIAQGQIEPLFYRKKRRDKRSA